ncbi:SIMPL domain-containing protein [Streptomyces scabiei]|uniref:SIMPL domain-containing protein n=1 Tax=Streptomyces scabiei TaxID=1930 RepID=UPI0038D4A283
MTTRYGPLSALDRDFITKVRLAGLWELPAGQQAETKGDTAAVRTAGEHLIEGHTFLDARVRDVAARLNVPLPNQPSDQQKQWLATLDAARGETYDREFANILRLAHGRVFSVVAQVRATTRNSLVRALADDANTTVLDLLKTYGQAVERLETGAFSLTPELKEKGRGERIQAYHGRVHITADLTDFTTLGELTTRLADLDLTRVDGPWWSLRPASPAHRKARQQAVKEAVQRAREYAEALDTTLAALVELADIGAEAPQPLRPAAPGGIMRSARAKSADDTDAPPLDLEPQRQHVYAQVNARFTMHPPRL